MSNSSAEVCNFILKSESGSRYQLQSIKSVCDFIKTQISTIAVSLTLFNCARLPREAFKYGVVPYLVLYSIWLVIAGFPVTLLQLAVGQLSEQDPVGAWRAVPILRGVGHLQLLLSYVACVCYMIYGALSLAFLLWVGKGSFPLKECTRLRITPNGYENKMNASDCFRTTFLAPFSEHPQYLGVMAILIFILWFFVPIFLYRLRKSLKVALNIFAPLVIILAIVLTTFLADGEVLNEELNSCEQWAFFTQPNIWFSAMTQALMSTQVANGYLISAGGNIYRHSDVRWTSIFMIMTNLVAGWLWVLMWESIGGRSMKDTGFVATLILIYQSSVNEKRDKQWPLIALIIVLFSAIITVLLLLYPVYDKLHRLSNDNWRLFANVVSALGTAMSVAALTQGVEVVSMLDSLVVPVLAVFVTAVEVVGFVVIYGWCNVTFDIEFLTGSRLSCIWIITWWSIPILFLGVTGWWLRTLLYISWAQGKALWPLVGAFVGILVVMIIFAAIAVAKEEQYNLFLKFVAAFRPSRLWGPEEPMCRYIWMSQKQINQPQPIGYTPTIDTIPQYRNENHYTNYPPVLNNNYQKQKTKNSFTPNTDKHIYGQIQKIYSPHKISNGEQMKTNGIEKLHSTNICIDKGNLNSSVECNCSRHFTLNVPNLKREASTSL